MPRRTRSSTFQPVSIDSKLGEPLHRQLYDELRGSILSGRLPPGARLPASRELAALSGVSRNTVMLAFEQLRAEGYISGRLGSGTYVADALPEHAMSPTAQPSAPDPASGSRRPLSRRGERLVRVQFGPCKHPVVGDAFRSGMPALDRFPHELWRQVLNRRMSRSMWHTLAYDDPRGFEPVRRAIATHLAEARGARCSPDQIIITLGAQQALDLAVRVLADPGDSVLMEDPGYFGARALFEGEGLKIVPVPVDDEGMDVAAGVSEAPRARLAYVTPSHQHPLGVMMSLPRRLALLAWAEREGAWILEDDYASEYRYSGRPLAALQGIDHHGRVIYIGTFSKTLFPALRLGYLVAPPDLAPVLATARQLVDRQPPVLAQLAVSDFIAEGHYARHLRRMRKLYAERQEMLIDVVAREIGAPLELPPADAGMNLVGWLPHDLDDCAVDDAAAALGVQTSAITSYGLRPNVRRGGLVLGYTGIDREQMTEGARRLAQAIRSVVAGHSHPVAARR
jgi:GntR family transcriptional regulator/MocR family aminotransferase